MKTITKKILSILFLATLLSACNVNMFNRINGNKNVVTENRKVNEDFSKIKVSTGLDLYITQGSTSKIIVEADENLQEIIKTEINDGVLKIYSEKNIWRAKSRKVYVTLETLEAVTATSGSDVYTKEIIKVNDIDLKATSGADIRITLDANAVTSSATSGSDIEISGITNNHVSSATSGASIDAYELRSKNVTVNVSSGADINVYASESISAKASSGGDIDFKGSPKQVNKKSSSGGSISAK
ncbi:head GIN domain-containing protein [Polaribacter sp. R77954]|uniref:head GIN domain-containing protein n=1 Tax=Polaribacter sp. R77954 TaxID=3093870 RepID=UPI0037CB2598